jgi:hypothetical protein
MSVYFKFCHTRLRLKFTKNENYVSYSSLGLHASQICSRFHLHDKTACIVFSHRLTIMLSDATSRVHVVFAFLLTLAFYIMKVQHIKIVLVILAFLNIFSHHVSAFPTRQFVNTKVLQHRVGM